jgi:putative endonuclease
LMNTSAIWHMYVVKCRDDSLYCGVTTCVERRLHEHNTSHRGAKYTRSRRPVVLVFDMICESRSAALKAEAAFKRMTRKQKLHMIHEYCAALCAIP